MPRALDTSLRVAVIGGGPAGITAATYLEDAGFKKKVTVFEREAQVGGKCKTIFVDGRAHDMGAVELTPDYVNTLTLAARAQAQSLVDVPPTLYRDRATGVAKPPAAWMSPSQLDAFRAAISKYLELRTALDEKPAFQDPGLRGATADLAVSFGAWLHVNGLDILRGLFAFPITCFGYGPIDAIPALYALKFMNVPNFAVAVAGRFSVDLLPMRYQQSSVGWPKRFQLGFQTLMERLAQRLDLEPLTGVTALKVWRNDTSGAGPIRVDYTRAGVQHTSHFDRLIIATPRVVEASGASFVQDLTNEERALFGQVITQNYYTVLNEPSAVPYAVQANVIMNGALSEPPTDTTAMFPRIWERPGADHGPQWLQTIWYVNEPPTVDAASAPPPSVSHVEAIVAADVASQGMTLTGAQQGFGWTYFPHFPSTAIAPSGGTGAHDRLFALQGQNGTFYAGGLMNFELVENTITYSKWLIETIFA